jgi:hypothetical protein
MSGETEETHERPESVQPVSAEQRRSYVLKKYNIHYAGTEIKLGGPLMHAWIRGLAGRNQAFSEFKFGVVQLWGTR